MANDLLASAVWLGLALLALLIPIRIVISVALIEIVVGAFAGNIIGLHLTEWVNFLAGAPRRHASFHSKRTMRGPAAGSRHSEKIFAAGPLPPMPLQRP
jgi:hypothetical protein